MELPRVRREAELLSANVTSSPVLRLASSDDAPAIAALMRASVRSEFPKLHDARQTESAAVYISRLDPVLIDDGTYFVHDVDGSPGRLWWLEQAGQALSRTGPRPTTTSACSTRGPNRPGSGPCSPTATGPAARPGPRHPPGQRARRRRSRLPLPDLDGHPPRRPSLPRLGHALHVTESERVVRVARVERVAPLLVEVVRRAGGPISFG